MRATACNEPRIQKLRVTRQYIVADLTDGRIIKLPLAGRGVFQKRLRNSGRILKSWAPVRACTGQRSTKTSVLTGCCTGYPRDDRDRLSPISDVVVRYASGDILSRARRVAGDAAAAD